MHCELKYRCLNARRTPEFGKRVLSHPRPSIHSPGWISFSTTYVCIRLTTSCSLWEYMRLTLRRVRPWQKRSHVTTVLAYEQRTNRKVFDASILARKMRIPPASAAQIHTVRKNPRRNKVSVEKQLPTILNFRTKRSYPWVPFAASTHCFVNPTLWSVLSFVQIIFVRHVTSLQGYFCSQIHRRPPNLKYPGLGK